MTQIKEESKIEPLVGRAWIPIGPSPISKDLPFNGLVSAIAINPSNQNIIYIGTGGGGMWRSMDGGQRWMPLFDRELTLGVGEPSGLAIDPNNTNILYLGTSNRINREPRSQLVFLNQWTEVTVGLDSVLDIPLGNIGNADQFFNQNINVIIVDPANSNTLYLASNFGVFRSTDGGLNWTRGMVPPPTGILVGDAHSLVLDTSATGSRILYAGISSEWCLPIRRWWLELDTNSVQNHSSSTNSLGC